MEKHIGMDAHSSICVFCVVDGNGVEVSQAKIAANGKLLVEYLRSIEGPKKLVFEECELSAWLFETLRGEADELIVCNPTRNRQYKKAKTDKLDAQNLSRLLRGGFLRPVYHDGSKTEQLRALMSGYQDVVDTGVSVKNRYKSGPLNHIFLPLKAGQTPIESAEGFVARINSGSRPCGAAASGGRVVEEYSIVVGDKEKHYG